MKSKLYTGLLRHRRHEPTMHNFTYRVFMPFLCLQELPELLDKIPLWSARHFALGYFRRSDFLGDKKNSLIEEVRQRIFTETKALHEGPIFLLAFMFVWETLQGGRRGNRLTRPEEQNCTELQCNSASNLPIIRERLLSAFWSLMCLRSHKY